MFKQRRSHLSRAAAVLAAGLVALTVWPAWAAPAPGTWDPTGAMAQARSDHTATLLNDGTVLVAGGRAPYLASAELYDPATGTRSATGVTKTPGPRPAIQNYAPGSGY
jgi:hypothetical protein